MSVYSGNKNVGSRFLAAKSEYRPPAYALFNYQKILQDAYRQQQWKTLGEERKGFRESRLQSQKDVASGERQTSANEARTESARIAKGPTGAHDLSNVTPLSRSKIISQLKSGIIKTLTPWGGYEDKRNPSREEAVEWIMSHGYRHYQQDSLVMKELSKLPSRDRPELKPSNKVDDVYKRLKGEHPDWPEAKLFQALIGEGY